MIENDEARPSTADEIEKEPITPRPVWSWGIFCCLLAFLACLVLMITPNYRLIGSTFLAPLATTHFLVSLGAWLPSNFHWLPNAKASFTSTNNIEFLFLVGLAFVFYGALMLILLRLPVGANYMRIQTLVWACATVGGVVLIFTPFLLSHDLFVYSDYGHTILTYHANLYFTPPIAISHSNITLLDDWKHSVAAYGPLWLGFSVLVALVGGDDPLRYIIGFRALGLLAHLVNIWLVMCILRASGRSPRTVMLGALLYALNPLMLIESAMGAHNDTEMITFLLLGILLCLRAEQRGFARFIDYTLPAVAFSLAILIKYSSLPVLILYLALLARKAWLADASTPQQPDTPHRRWRAALFKSGAAAALSAAIVLFSYAPFWVGHSLVAILNSFAAPPSARFAENSILHASQKWIHLHGWPPSNSWLHILLLLTSNHTNWNIASLVVILGGTVYGIILLWRRPVTHTLTLASLFTLGALLIVTPWLFSWYVTWLIALAAVLLGRPPVKAVLRDALVAFAIAFSISIFFTYMDHSLPIFGEDENMQCLRIFGIPLLAFLLVLILGLAMRAQNRPGTASAV